MPSKPTPAPAGFAADSPARSSEDGVDPLFAYLAARSAEAKKEQQAQVDALLVRAEGAAGKYADECREAVRGEEGKIKARLEAYRAEDARLAAEVRKTETELLELLQAQASDVKLVVAAVQDQREKLAQGSARIAQSVAKLAAEHNNAVAEEVEKVWLFEGEQPRGGEGGGAAEEGRRMEVDEYSA
ncbi:hypothetical protein JCM10449v2_008246 [Rhodotorula kratochvilovae]